MPEATPEIPEDEAATKLGDAYDLDIKATVLREFADRIDVGPGIPLPPSVYSALAREHAEDAEQQADELRDSVPSPEPTRCRVVEVDGEPMWVQGGEPMDEEGKAAFRQLVGAAKRRMQQEKAEEEAAIRADERAKVRTEIRELWREWQTARAENDGTRPAALRSSRAWYRFMVAIGEDLNDAQHATAREMGWDQP